MLIPGGEEGNGNRVAAEGGGVLWAFGCAFYGKRGDMGRAIVSDCSLEMENSLAPIVSDLETGEVSLDQI